MAAGATNYSVRLRMSHQYNNNGPVTSFRLDGADGFMHLPDTTMATGVTCGYRKLSGGIYQIWMTGTWVAPGTKEFDVGVTPNTSVGNFYYAAAATDAVQIASVQLSATSNPAGYVATVAATASQPAESAIFNDTSWLTTAQGTFIVEHDCWTGPLIGSGVNAVLSATRPGITAIAWSGTTSDTVSNGGSTTIGGLPTFSGSDVRLLSTSAASNTGHIKSIKFSKTRLTVADIQARTAKTVVSTATPGVLRGVSTKNRLPSVAYTTGGALLYHQVEFDMPLGNFAASALRLDFPGIVFPGAAVGNPVIVDACYLRRVTGVDESVQVFVGGSGSFTVASGAATTVVSDAISPAAFTALTQFDPLMRFKVRLRCHVATTGQNIAGSRSRYDPDGAFCIRYDPALTTPSAVSGTTAMSSSGSSPTYDDYGYCPVLVGIPVSGDPKTAFTVGDSIVEGIGSITHQGPGTYIKRACMALGIPNIEHSLVGTSQRELALSTGWTPYMKYARVLIDEMGTNNVNALLDYFTYWNIAKTTYGYDKFVRSGLTPRTTSTDGYVTELNQTAVRAYPSAVEIMMAALEKFGGLDKNFVPMSVRGVDPAKWTSTVVATADGLHQNIPGDDLMKTEFQPVMAAITVT